MSRHAKALSKAKGLISLLSPTLSTIKHDFSRLKLINMIRFASYSKHAKVSNQILINILSHDYKVVIIIHIVLIIII
jgi:hypothetical protein